MTILNSKQRDFTSCVKEDTNIANSFDSNQRDFTQERTDFAMATLNSNQYNFTRKNTNSSNSSISDQCGLTLDSILGSYVGTEFDQCDLTQGDVLGYDSRLAFNIGEALDFTDYVGPVDTAIQHSFSPPRRPVKVLLETPWSDMTLEEKARLLLPILNGQNPNETEEDEVKHRDDYGAQRQREALQKAQGMVADVAAQAIVTQAPIKQQGPELDEYADEDELATLEARVAHMKAQRAAEAAQKKRDATNAKRAESMRRKRAQKKQEKRPRCQREEEDGA